MADKLSDKLWNILNDSNMDGYMSVKQLCAIDEARSLVKRIEDAPVAIMDTRDLLGICAPTEDDFPALYALQGKHVRLVVEGGE